MLRLPRLLLCLLTSALQVGPLERGVAAQEQRLDIHGFGGWVAGYTDNDNLYPDLPYPIASEDLEVDNAYFTLNLLARPAEKLAIHAQPTWRVGMSNRDVRLDLVYVELTLAKDLLARAGKIKNPLGLYTEIYKVGTLRPFYLLPNAFYRQAPESYAGLGLNRVQTLGTWELELDFLAGQMDFEPWQSDMIVGFDPATGPQFGSVMTGATGKDMFGGGALVRPPIAGLEIGVSAYGMRLYGGLADTPFVELRCGSLTAPEPCGRQQAYTASLEYLRDRVALRSEFLTTRGYLETDNFYAEAAFKVTGRWELAATYDYTKQQKPRAVAPAAEALARHSGVGFGLNYWVNPRLVWKLDYYHVSDNRAARPPDALNRALRNDIDDTTNVLLAGLHFSF